MQTNTFMIICIMKMQTGWCKSMVKKIPLTQGKHALIDDEDYEWANQWKWYAHCNKGRYYVVRSQCVKTDNGEPLILGIRLHRLLMERVIGHTLESCEFIDHINHNPLDNRKENLRIATPRQNAQNRKHPGKSKYPGVTWDKITKNWRATIQLNGKRKTLGRFKTERLAAKAYESACREHAGEELICKSGGMIYE